MKKRLSAFFKNPRDGKKRRIVFILTVVALIELFAIMLVSTSSWVESISSIKIFTTLQDKADGTYGLIRSKINQQINIDSTSANTYDLTSYFRPSGAFHFAGASSVDGNTMYFPEYSSNSSTYRIGGINDKNVNYISFTIKTTNSTAVNLAFDQIPTISFGGTALADNPSTTDYDERKLVRFSVGKGSDFKVYSLYPTKFTEEIPADESVVPESIVSDPDDDDYHKGFSTTTVYPFADFVKGRDRILETSTNGLLTFSMWIQDPEREYKSVYDNKELTVTGMKLVVVTPFIVYAYRKSGNSYIEDTTGVSGTVAIENGAYGNTATYYAVPGQQINVHALASESSGYSFTGWSTYANRSSTDPNTIISSNANYTYQVPSDATATNGKNKLIAKFNNEHDLYMRPDYVHKNADGSSPSLRYAAYVFGVSSDGTFSGTWYSMTAVSSGTWKDYYKCSYVGNATSVIFCYMNGANNTNSFDNRWLQTYDLVVPSRPGEYGYIVTCRQVLNGVTANGITYANGRNQKMNTSSPNPHDFGTNKLLGYWNHNKVEIDVAYTSNSDFSETYGGTYSESISSRPKICASLTDTARAYSNAWWYNDEKELYLDGKAYQDVDNQGNLIAQYKYEKKVTLTAATLSAYDFVGWYEDEEGTDLISTNKEVQITAPDNGTYKGSNITNTKTYYAKYTRKPEQWYLFGLWDNWANGIELSSTSTSNVIAASKELYPTNDNTNYTFKLYEATTQEWYSVNYTFKENYFGPQTLSNSVSDNAQLYVENRAKYTFSFNTSNHQLTIKRETIPTINISVDTQTKYGTMTNPNNYVKFSGGTNTTTNTSETYTTTEGSTTSVTVVATANTTYYTFAGWYENGYKVSDNASYSFSVTSSTKDRNLEAKFNQKTKYIEFQNAKDWGGTVYCYAWQNSTGDSPAVWRGTQMTATDTYTNGHRHYSITLWTKYDRVKFNTSNGNETGDLTVPTDSKYRYHNSGTGGWY